jgi:hypothetical protein
MKELKAMKDFLQYLQSFMVKILSSNGSQCLQSLHGKTLPANSTMKKVKAMKDLLQYLQSLHGEDLVGQHPP